MVHVDLVLEQPEVGDQQGKGDSHLSLPQNLSLAPAGSSAEGGMSSMRSGKGDIAPRS